MPELLPVCPLVSQALPALCRSQYRSSLVLWHSLSCFGWRTLVSRAPLALKCERWQRRQQADWLAWQYAQLEVCQSWAEVMVPGRRSLAARCCGHLADGLLLYGRRALRCP